MDRSARSKIMLAVSMTVFGTVGIFVRHIPLASSEIALYRSLLAVILIGAFLIFMPKARRTPIAILLRALPLLIASGAALGFNWLLLFEAYKHTTISRATLAYYFAPILVTLLSIFFFGEKMNTKKWLCLALSALGIVMISGIGGATGSNHLLGALLGLAAACLYAAVVLINKFIHDVDDISRTFLQFVAAALVLLPYTALSGGFHLFELQVLPMAALLTVGILHTGITYCIYFSSIKNVSGQAVALMSYIDPLVAVVCSAVFLKERITAIEIIGGLLIIGSALLNEIRPKQNK